MIWPESIQALACVDLILSSSNSWPTMVVEGEHFCMVMKSVSDKLQQVVVVILSETALDAHHIAAEYICLYCQEFAICGGCVGSDTLSPAIQIISCWQLGGVARQCKQETRRKKREMWPLACVVGKPPQI